MPLDSSSATLVKSVNRIKPKKWSLDEIQLLKRTVEAYGTNWIEIAQMFPDRNANQCAQRWKRTAGWRSRQKNFWSQEEDEQLINLTHRYGKQWALIAKIMKQRTSKQCRERYLNKLDPQLLIKPFTDEEDQLIYEKYIFRGAKWSQFAKEMPGRSSDQLKNRFYAHVRQKYLDIKNPYYSNSSKMETEKQLETARKQHQIIISQQKSQFLEDEYSNKDFQISVYDESQPILFLNSNAVFYEQPDIFREDENIIFK